MIDKGLRNMLEGLYYMSIVRCNFYYTRIHPFVI